VRPHEAYQCWQGDGQHGQVIRLERKDGLQA
jgi:hypothetical protein